jgi:hypothetical protein
VPSVRKLGAGATREFGIDHLGVERPDQLLNLLVAFRSQAPTGSRLD